MIIFGSASMSVHSKADLYGYKQPGPMQGNAADQRACSIEVLEPQTSDHHRYMVDSLADKVCTTACSCHQA